MNAASWILGVTALVWFAAPLPAQELRVIGKNPTSGVSEELAFRGTLVIRSNAKYYHQRNYPDGRMEMSRGVARIDGRDLVLTPKWPVGAARRFNRADTHDRIRWTHTRGDERIEIDMGETESLLTAMGRAVARGKELRYVIDHNRGYVDRRSGAEIMRTRRPTPQHLIEFKKQGGRTVLSLNGKQDIETWYRKRPDSRPRRVKLRAFIQEMELGHVWLKMSSSRAPSDAELIKVFRVLLDDSRRPVLVHCQGGADRTGVVSALYQIEFLGVPKARAKKTMREFMWIARRGSEIQGAFIDLYQKGTLRTLLTQAGVPIPARYPPERARKLNRIP